MKFDDFSPEEISLMELLESENQDDNALGVILLHKQLGNDRKKKVLQTVNGKIDTSKKRYRF